MDVEGTCSLYVVEPHLVILVCLLPPPHPAQSLRPTDKEAQFVEMLISRGPSSWENTEVTDMACVIPRSAQAPPLAEVEAAVCLLPTYLQGMGTLWKEAGIEKQV